MSTINQSAFLSSILSNLYTVREYTIKWLIVSTLLAQLFANVNGKAPPQPYYGRLIGSFTQFAHGISGKVYAVDESTIFIKGFVYDGTGPDAFFWVGKTPRPNPEGYIIPYPEEYIGRDPPILQAHNNSDIILKLPMGKRIRDIRWLSVWCRRFTVDFGEVFIPASLDVPKPRVLPEFKRLAHGLRSSNISVLDAQTFYIPNLHYDGAGPDAYFWVGNGPEPNIMGIKVPNEMGSLEPLRGYQGEDIEIQLSGNLTVYDIDWLAVWCVEYRHNFGHVYIPKDLDVPPALGQTKITTTTTTPKPQITNCVELLSGKLQVKWVIIDDYVQIELSGRIKENQYMAFGLSGEQGRSRMRGADVAVAFYDTSQRIFRAVDYYLSDYSQCDGKVGACPDERIGGRNDIEVLTGDRKNGVTVIRYRRPLQTNEPINDRVIPSDREVSVIGAIGPLNDLKEANAHVKNGTDTNSEDIKINFSSKNDHSCVSSLYNVIDPDAPKPWPPKVLSGETVISARIGPTGGKRGYSEITGISSWGISWYLNDMLIPELYVERGQTYTFTVEGGNNPQQPARYHPFYITSSELGGFSQRTETEKQREKIYAGAKYTSAGYQPTAAGRYCEWQHKTIDQSEKSETFEEYMKTLKLECEEGTPAILNWTVATDTPDLVYYQCFTHRNLGWKIHVKDPSDRNKSQPANQISAIPLILFITTIFVLTITKSISYFNIDA